MTKVVQSSSRLMPYNFSIIIFRASSFHPPHKRPQEKKRTQKHQKPSHYLASPFLTKICYLMNIRFSYEIVFFTMPGSKTSSTLVE